MYCSNICSIFKKRISRQYRCIVFSRYFFFSYSFWDGVLSVSTIPLMAVLVTRSDYRSFPSHTRFLGFRNTFPNARRKKVTYLHHVYSYPTLNFRCTRDKIICIVWKKIKLCRIVLWRRRRKTQRRVIYARNSLNPQEFPTYGLQRSVDVFHFGEKIFTPQQAGEK